MKRASAGIVFALILAALALSVWYLRGRRAGPETTQPPLPATARPAGPPASDDPATTREPAGGPRRWAWDADPQGPLRLDGQVVDASGEPVGDAQISISTVPPATTRSQADGSFHFDKLVGRTFTLRGRAGAMVGSLSYKLTSVSDPVILRLRLGATLAVQVQDEAGQPVAGATVKLDEDDALTATTDGKGTALLVGVLEGWSRVTASAPGYAEGGGVAMVGDAGAAAGQATSEVTVVLRRGVAVSGKVVDDSGQPVANARVRADGGAATWAVARQGSTATSDAKGEFELPALPPGSFTITAIDGKHAPATSKSFTVGDQPVRELTVVMKAGGEVSGTVVTRDGSVVPFATVRITVEGGGDLTVAREQARQVASDDHGHFQIEGLPRAALQLRAEGERAASQVVELSLVEAPRREDLRVVLDVEGSIAGTVVDERGEPVPEIDVHAFPDVLAGADTKGLALAGLTSTTSDGSGGFVIRGLPEGAYRLWASRAGSSLGWGKHSASAKVGDRDVRLTVAAPGRLVGKLVHASDGRAPAFASVTISGRMPVTTRTGSFTIAELEPGRYDLTVRGPEFAERTVRDLEITAGHETDAGTITVTRGRRLVGLVLDRNRRPVAEARVRVGEYLVSDGSSGGDDRNLEQAQGVLSAMTDRQGRFVVTGLPGQKAVTAIAEHPTAGKSPPLEVAGGDQDPPEITLQLRGFGSLAGAVTIKGKPAGKVSISVAPKDGGMNGVFVSTSDDGSYAIDRVPEGPQVVMVMRSGGLSMSGTSATVDVVAGKRAKLDIDIKGGELSLTTEIKAKPGQRVDAAQVFLFADVVDVKNGKQLLEKFSQGALGMQIWFGATAPALKFQELEPGTRSLCSIPITGNLLDPQFMQRIQENRQTLAVYCQQVVLPPAPQNQSVTLELPAMTPLPEPPAPAP